MGTAEIRQCWAFHLDGTRCDMPAGHNGDHTVERTWTDAECAVPNTQPAPPPPVVPLPAPLVQENLSCVACNHKHKGVECKCGCREFIG